MASMNGILKFENSSDEEKINFLKSCSYNELSSFKSCCLLLDRPNVVLEVEELCKRIDSQLMEEMFNDDFEMRMKLQMEYLNDLLANMDQECLDEDLINRLDAFFEQSYHIVLEKMIAGFKKSLLQLKKEGKGYSSFTFGFTMMQLDKRPATDAFISYLEEKYREKISEYGLDVFGFSDIRIAYKSYYSQRIEDELKFRLTENEQERYRYLYTMSVYFSVPKHKQYSLGTKKENVNKNEQ